MKAYNRREERSRSHLRAPADGTSGTHTPGCANRRIGPKGASIVQPKLVTHDEVPIAGEVLDGTESQKRRALKAFRKFGTVSKACRVAGIGRRTWYNWLERDPSFAPLLADMKEDVADELEETAHKRAMAGSDRLLIFLLKSNRPWKYRESAMITMVSPVVKEHVRETVMIIRQMLTKEQSDAVLARLNVVWQESRH